MAKVFFLGVGLISSLYSDSYEYLLVYKLVHVSNKSFAFYTTQQL